jgi:hypothetical protein
MFLLHHLKLHYLTVIDVFSDNLNISSGLADNPIACLINPFWFNKAATKVLTLSTTHILFQQRCDSSNQVDNN